MQKKFQPGDVVTLKSVKWSRGRTIRTVKRGKETKSITTGGKETPAPPMVVRATADKKDYTTVHCYYYSAKLDQFIDRWFMADLLEVSHKATTPTSVKEASVVTLASALVRPRQTDYRYQFSLTGLGGKQKFTLRKTFGAANYNPPLLNVVKMKEATGKSKHGSNVALCLWQNSRTGKLSETELPLEVLTAPKR